MDKKRRLAAILFADIVDYTAMMQSEEGKAMHKLRHYQSVLKREVAACGGEIIKNYGDGSLCLFSNVLDSVACASAIQKTLRSEPIVPLRIGIHLGDVMYAENDIYGNAINVASRIESMGIAGSVLMSKDIQKKISNQSSLPCKSLGTYQFKNIVEPLEIFALANDSVVLPKPGDINGQLTKRRVGKLWYFLIPILLLIGAFGTYHWLQSSKTTILVEDIRNDRIAVLPFQNNTNDRDLNIFGDMSADWINRGLMEIEGIEVTSPFTVRSNLGALGIAPNDPQGRSSFSELTGAQNMLSGSYYEQNGDIVFQLQIESAINGQLLYVFESIRGPKNDKEGLLTKLGSQVAGYWVARELVDTKNVKPPKYEAYVAYHNALQKINAGAEFSNVFQLDSSFYLARIHYLHNNRHGMFGDNSAHFKFLERHVHELSGYELAWFNYLKGLYIGDAKEAFESLNKLRLDYPKDFIINHETAVIAAEDFNNAELATEIYSELPIEEIDASSVGIYYNNRILNQVISFIKLNQFSELSDFINTVNVSESTVNSAFVSALLIKALAENDQDEIDQAYTQFLELYDTDRFSFFLQMHFNLHATNTAPIRGRLSKDFLSYYHRLDDTDINKRFWKSNLAMIEGKSQNVSIEEIKKPPKIISIMSLYAEGVVNLSNNDMDQVYYYIDQLKEYTSTDYNTTSAIGPGAAYYYLGKLFTKMGKTDDAIQYLQKSRKFGWPVWLSCYKYDDELTSLVGLSEFDAITNPIWQEVMK